MDVEIIVDRRHEKSIWKTTAYETAVDEVTGFPEILDGRVKTLAPE